MTKIGGNKSEIDIGALTEHARETTHQYQCYYWEDNTRNMGG